ncbi:MAG: carbon-nitrogen hydrolase, partial [Actinophytocola sp.]|nr:carbon-nitrogen hydrolase [Actinophytocola sp.]
MPRVRIAIHQGPATAAGAAALAVPAARAAAAGAHVLVCPEMITTGYHIGAEIPKVAEAAGGPTAAVVAGIAREHRIAIVYGYPERDGEAVFNSVQLVGGDGARLANYRKTHLFGELDRTWFTPGHQAVVQAELHGMRIGLLLCYDVEFPEIVRAHALAGTELLLVPTALMSPYEIVADTV